MARGDVLSDNSGPGSVAHLARGVENRLIAEGVPVVDRRPVNRELASCPLYLSALRVGGGCEFSDYGSQGAGRISRRTRFTGRAEVRGGHSHFQWPRLD